MPLNFTTPTARIVGGDPYNVSPVLDDKTKVQKVRKDGKPQVASFLALAIAKNDPEWPAFKAMCDAEAAKAWPNGQAQHPQFASKIEDGDSAVPNKRGKKNCDREGYAGHWIVKVGSGYAPTVHVWLTAAEATAQNRVPPGKQTIDGWYASAGGEVGLGDYVKVFGSIDGNGSSDSPGMYMNYNMSALQRKGVPIVIGVDANDAFGAAPPPGNGQSAPAVSHQPTAATTPGTATASHTDWMAPTDDAPPPPSSGPVMTAKAGGKPLESFTSKGWTLAQLKEHGYVE